MKEKINTVKILILLPPILTLTNSKITVDIIHLRILRNLETIAMMLMPMWGYRSMMYVLKIKYFTGIQWRKDSHRLCLTASGPDKTRNSYLCRILEPLIFVLCLCVQPLGSA